MKLASLLTLFAALTIGLTGCSGDSGEPAPNTPAPESDLGSEAGDAEDMLKDMQSDAEEGTSDTAPEGEAPEEGSSGVE